MELPIVNTDVVERADAARNRRRILAAAEKLFAENGVGCTSMDAIATEAGVGKGTLFRRFGDRGTLALAVLDETERELQDAVLSGPSPLGPGAAPCERLIAFGEAVLDRIDQQTDLMVEAEVASGRAFRTASPTAARWMHIRTLIDQTGFEGDGDYVADVLLNALGAPLYVYQRDTREMDLKRLKAGWRDLVGKLLR